MKMNLSTSHAASLLVADESANWSYAGATALVEYLEDLEADTDSDMEFDRVALRCDYSEYASLQEWALDHLSENWEEEIGIEPDDDDDETEEKIRDYIQDRGTLIEFGGGVIVSSF